MCFSPPRPPPPTTLFCGGGGGGADYSGELDAMVIVLVMVAMVVVDARGIKKTRK